jgi:hypothetical protein
VKEVVINKHLSRSQYHNKHRQEIVNETVHGWAISEEGSRKSSKKK